jgi:hypothetical protein
LRQSGQLNRRAESAYIATVLLAGHAGTLIEEWKRQVALTRIFYTVDTELSSSRQRAGMSIEDNYDLSIEGRTAEGDFGLTFQCRELHAHGLTGVFFVDPLPALLYGVDLLRKMIEPILFYGHDIQLHVHTEWLEFLDDGPVGGRRGQNISDFSLADQTVLVDLAADLLEQACGSFPVAFRAGNFGANRDTLIALRRAGLKIDSSYHAGKKFNACDIRPEFPLLHPHMMAEGIMEYPISTFYDFGQHVRSMHLCAISSAGMAWLLAKAIEEGWPCVTILSHSFELIYRPARRAYGLQIRRFEQLCEMLSTGDSLRTAKFSDSVDVPISPTHALPRAPLALTVGQYVEQAYGRLRYEH